MPVQNKKRWKWSRKQKGGFGRVMEPLQLVPGLVLVDSTVDSFLASCSIRFNYYSRVSFASMLFKGVLGKIDFQLSFAFFIGMKLDNCY